MYQPFYVAKNESANQEDGGQVSGPRVGVHRMRHLQGPARQAVLLHARADPRHQRTIAKTVRGGLGRIQAHQLLQSGNCQDQERRTEAVREARRSQAHGPLRVPSLLCWKIPVNAHGGSARAASGHAAATPPSSLMNTYFDRGRSRAGRWTTLRLPTRFTFFQ